MPIGTVPFFMLFPPVLPHFRGLLKDFRVRLVTGGDEERGSSCLEYYFEKLKKPHCDYGFTPDADFPLIYAEKGIYRANISRKIDLSPIVAIDGGVVVNAVCDKVIVTLPIDKAFEKAFLEKKINGFMPGAIRTVFGPFLTVLIMIPLELYILAPLGSLLGNAVATLFEVIGNSPLGFLAIAIFAATYPMLVLTGMHIGIMGIAIANFGNVGSDAMFLMASTVQNFTASAVGLAVALKMKDPENKSLCWGYFLTQFFGGVGEPLLYGVFLRYKRPWIGSIAGGAEQLHRLKRGVPAADRLELPLSDGPQIRKGAQNAVPPSGT